MQFSVSGCDPNPILSPVDQVARTNTFLLIYRKFMRPGELLKMFIDRFEDLGDYVDEEDLEANNTRLRYGIDRSLLPHEGSIGL